MCLSGQVLAPSFRVGVALPRVATPVRGPGSGKTNLWPACGSSLGSRSLLEMMQNINTVILDNTVVRRQPVPLFQIGQVGPVFQMEKITTNTGSSLQFIGSCRLHQNSLDFEPSDAFLLPESIESCSLATNESTALTLESPAKEPPDPPRPLTVPAPSQSGLWTGYLCGCSQDQDSRGCSELGLGSCSSLPSSALVFVGFEAVDAQAAQCIPHFNSISISTN